MGGFYERLVKSVKLAMKKTIGHSLLSYFELETVIVEIEATINSRPLAYVSNESGEEVVSPSLLLLGRGHLDVGVCVDSAGVFSSFVKRRAYQRVLANQLENVVQKLYAGP